MRLREDAGVTPGAARRARPGVDRRLPRPDRGGHGAPVDRDVPAARLGARARTSARGSTPTPGPRSATATRRTMLELLLAVAPPALAAVHRGRRPTAEPRAGSTRSCTTPRARACRRRPSSSRELRRLEQLVRWSAREGRASLPSWEGWPHLGEEPAISRLLVVRRTRATRAVVDRRSSASSASPTRPTPTTPSPRSPARRRGPDPRWSGRRWTARGAGSSCPGR